MVRGHAMPSDGHAVTTRFDGEVAIVTGGAGGIGSATCRKLAAEGARVVVADIEAAAAEALADELGATAIAFDLGDPDDVERLVAETVRLLGRLDVLVNNAALRTAQVMREDTTVETMSAEGFRRAMDVNALGCALACKHAIPHLRAAGGGSIVNLTSEQALAGANIGSDYAAAKAAIIATTRMVATQNGRDGIRCNAVAPGLIVTSDRIRENTALMEAVVPHVLLGRLGEPEDVADLIAFLASGEARYITGQVLAVDGGYLAHMPAPG
jgi:NAD(P)-dependent dehydrogenase (short-subunit alcohol dehydrogenase family)